MTQYKSHLVYLLIFSFLFAGCYTTEYYSYAPENLSAENAIIIDDDEYTLVKVFTKTHGAIDLEGFFYKFTDKKIDSASGLIYRPSKPVYDTLRNADNTIQKISFKTQLYDTIKISDIKVMSFEKKYFNPGKLMLYLGIATAAFVVTMAILVISSWEQ